MSFTSFLATLLQPRRPIRQRRPAAARGRSYRPSMEMLEDRTAPALFIVNALTDNNSGGGGAGSGSSTGGSGDLRWCITEANMNNGSSGSDTILFGVSGLITLAAVLPDISDNVNLTAPENSFVIVDGNSLGSVFRVNSGETVSLSGLTMTGGSEYQGGGILNNGTLTASNCTISGNSANNNGGGIYNNGTLTASNCTISGNSAEYGAGGILNLGTLTASNCTISGNSDIFYGGGGIANFGTLTASNCTISGNSAEYGTGGGIYNDEGTLTASNCTLSGNSAEDGGGIYNDVGGMLAVSNCTISRNSATTDGGGAFINGGSATLYDTIDADNSGTDPAIDGAVSASVTIGGVTYGEGYNLIGNGTGSSGVTNGVNGDQVGTSASSINPDLGPLQDNGGPTQTIALLPGSPAINAGDPNTASLPEFDQRGPGFPRIIGGRVDIGAYESASLPSATEIVSVGGASQNTVLGAAFATPLQALVTDDFGNPVSGVYVTFTAPTGGSTGVFNGPVVVPTNALGIATAPTLTANHLAGSFTVTASASVVAEVASFNLTITAVPASIAAFAGTGQHATVYTEFASPLQAIVKNASGQPVVGITVNFEAPTSGAGAYAAGPLSVVTNASGIATSPALIANTTAGSYTVLASVAGVAGLAKFTLTNTAGAAASVSALDSPQSAVIHGAYKPLQALVVDSYGNPVAGTTVTFTAPGSGASGTFAAGKNTAVSAANGIATAPAFTADGTVGSFQVSASIGVGTPATFGLTNLAAAPAHATASAGTTPQTATVATQFGTALRVLVTNAAHQPVSGDWVTFSAPASGESGTFSGASSISVQTNASGIATAPALTANTVAGTFKVSATVSGLAGSVSFSLTNQPGSPAALNIVSGNNQHTNPGQRFPAPLIVLVTDAFGNVLSDVLVTFTIQTNADTGAGGAFGANQTATIDTSATGHATAPVLTANASAGTFTVEVSIGNGVPDVTFTLVDV